ncbi:hypothetical protein [Parasphingorhabdus flavimaris]|uniref:hypothetical protein n=1 Tax=Parasphingorhabdus flavimaris TaxID=266812 RepID=UPI003001D9E1
MSADIKITNVEDSPLPCREAAQTGGSGVKEICFALQRGFSPGGNIILNILHSVILGHLPEKISVRERLRSG